MTSRSVVAQAWKVLRAGGIESVLDQVSHRTRRAVHRRFAKEPYLRAPVAQDHSLGMISPEERAYLQWYGANEFTGAGVIVDLGSWIGSSATNIALGLERNPRLAPFSRWIHAYDRFIWEEWMDSTALGTELAGRYRAGDLFTDEFRRRTSRWAPLIEVHEGDLTKAAWDQNDPIEMAFNDASKSWELVESIARTFYPALLPGRSIVVEQDFAHYYTPWVHLLRHRFRRCFEPVLHVRFSASAVFRCTGAVPGDLLREPLDFASFSEDEIEQAFAASLSLVSPEMRANVAAARVMLYVHAGDTERARVEYGNARKNGFGGRDLIHVGRLLRRA